METTEIKKTTDRRALFVVGVVLACVLVAALAAAAIVYARHRLNPATVAPTKVNEPAAEKTVHFPLPSEVRGVYITASTASSFNNFTALLAKVKAKGANTIVLDVKASGGALAFEPTSSALKAEAPVKILIADLDRLVASVHDNGFYLIARFPVFEDPAFAGKNPTLALHQTGGGLWHDAHGLAWLDPSAQAAWKYTADIAKELYARGFDEVQFDYVRFATDGSTSKIVYPSYDPKRENMRSVIGRFFAYMDNELRGAGIPISVDVFGFTTWHQTDLGIGQWYADALSHFDFVSAMVYPSHYPAGTLHFKNPAEHPYEIVVDSLKKGGEVVTRLSADPTHPHLATQRPWIQAFNMGAVYTPAMITAQIKAARDAGSSGFLLWNAANNYSSLPDLTK